MDGSKVIRATGVPMSSPEGSSMLAGLFGNAVGPDDVEVFPFELLPASVLVPHVHTSDLAAWMTEGRMAFGFGDGFAERPSSARWLLARFYEAELALQLPSQEL